ncbi:MAG: phosphopantetheine-binding protein [Acutalibacteraceae bacterium]|nr:phosphopantetheine-binding protein [Acutalibacteraceae bacterium]
MEVQAKIIELLAEATDTDAAEITADTAFADLGIDSLDLTEMAMQLEEEFDIELEMKPEISTVGKLTEVVESLRG